MLGVRARLRPNREGPGPDAVKMSHHGLGVHEEIDMDRAFVSEGGPREKPIEGCSGRLKTREITTIICLLNARNF